MKSKKGIVLKIVLQLPVNLSTDWLILSECDWRTLEDASIKTMVLDFSRVGLYDPAGLEMVFLLAARFRELGYTVEAIGPSGTNPCGRFRQLLEENSLQFP